MVLRVSLELRTEVHDGPEGEFIAQPGGSAKRA
jgi:hypothetical protein